MSDSHVPALERVDDHPFLEDLAVRDEVAAEEVSAVDGEDQPDVETEEASTSQRTHHFHTPTKV